MRPFDLVNKIRVLNPHANIDELYGPYENLQEAISAIPLELRILGRTVGIITGNSIEEYWWKEDISDLGLILKIADIDISTKAETNASNLSAPNVISWRTALDIYSKSQVDTALGLKLNRPLAPNNVPERVILADGTTKPLSEITTDISGKVDKPTVDGTWMLQKVGSVFDWVAGVMQNISNADLSNVSARIFTQGNTFTWNTAGFPYQLKNLLNKSTDGGSNRYLSYNPTTGDVGFREFASVRTGTFNPPTLSQLATLGIISGEFYKCTTTGQISIFNGEQLDNWYATASEWNVLSVAQKNAVKNFHIL